MLGDIPMRASASGESSSVHKFDAGARVPGFISGGRPPCLAICRWR
jgi:hypothetical protein